MEPPHPFEILPSISKEVDMRNQKVQMLVAQHSQGSEDEAVIGYSQVRNNYSQIEK
jgi:hypothetical protein